MPKLERSIEVNEEQPKNIKSIFMTFFIKKFEISKLAIKGHQENITHIKSITCIKILNIYTYQRREK